MPPEPGLKFGFVEELAKANPSLIDIDGEIEDLEGLLTKTTNELHTDLGKLLKKVDRYKPPESERLLSQRANDERMYVAH